MSLPPVRGLFTGSPNGAERMAKRKAKRGPGAYAQGTGDFFDTSTVQVAGTGIKVTWAVNCSNFESSFK